MSLELETLDQLLGGDLPLAVVRGLYPDDQTFAQVIHALVRGLDVRLLTIDGRIVPRWQWRGLFVEMRVLHRLPQFRLSITEQGARKVS
jgi:hypothetical protein